jgi:hypothetical protein
MIIDYTHPSNNDNNAGTDRIDFIDDDLSTKVCRSISMLDNHVRLNAMNAECIILIHLVSAYTMSQRSR